MYNITNMKFGKTVGNFFALDIGTTALRVIELENSRSGWNLVHYATKPIPARMSASTATKDVKDLEVAITDVINQSGIKEKDVAIGIPSDKMFASVVDVPTVSPSELNATIKYQAENYVPMRADEAKIDWAILGPSPASKDKTEVLIASVLNTFTEQRLEMLENDLKLNVIAIEPDSIALTRALLPDDVVNGRLIVNMEDSATDVIVTLGRAPRLLRSIPVGMNTLVKSVQKSFNVDEQQARQLVLKFGVEKTALNGQLYHSIDGSINQLMSELVKSVQFFTRKYKGMRIEVTMVSGYTATLNGFANLISNKTRLPVQIATPWQHINVPDTEKATLGPISAQFAVAAGLAERIN